MDTLASQNSFLDDSDELSFKISNSDLDLDQWILAYIKERIPACFSTDFASEKIRPTLNPASVNQNKELMRKVIAALIT